MLLHTPSQYSSLLAKVAEGLDIPDHLYENAATYQRRPHRDTSNCRPGR